MDSSLTHNRAELGYWLGKDYRGRGIMKEAISLMLDLGFKELNLDKITDHVFITNTPSAKHLEKDGFMLEGILRRHVLKEGRRFDVFAYGLLREEWEKLR